jgi:parallel beta-helix repeat protein
MSAKLRLHAAPATVVFFVVILGLVGVALVTLSGAEAAGQGQPKCGDTITTDTTLHRDLLDCPNNGIIIGADNITLDLNGHLIDGDGETPAAGCHPRKEFCDVGVLNRGHDGVIVRHGSVREFNVGVWGLNMSHNRILGISSSSEGCCGLGFFRGTRSLVRNSSGNGDGDLGMFLIASHHVRVLDNSFRDNRREQGIFVRESTHNLIKGNLTSRNPVGITFEDSNRNQVKRNRSVREAQGLDLQGNGNVIARNRFAHMIRRSGHRKGVAITVCCANHNLIAGNSIRDTDGSAITLGTFGGVGNVVRSNHIHGAGKDGVHVFAKVGKKPKHTLLKRNHVFGAKDDGLDANAPTTKLTRNEARRNGDLGIEAVPGVIDGGGNKASGNGDPRQCANITCN